MPFSVDSLLTDTDWIPMSLKGQQESPTYYWEDGGLLKDAPVDFDATFAENMWVSTKPIQFMTFFRNPLKVVPNFTVPRHLHNIDETIIVFKGEYKIEFGDPAEGQFVTVKPGCFFTSRAGTPYTMTAGPEGVTYIETWGTPVTSLKTVWYDFGWVRKYPHATRMSGGRHRRPPPLSCVAAAIACGRGPGTRARCSRTRPCARSSPSGRSRRTRAARTWG